jgi:hypothetical protein
MSQSALKIPAWSQNHRTILSTSLVQTSSLLSITANHCQSVPSFAQFGAGDGRAAKLRNHAFLALDDLWEPTKGVSLQSVLTILP